MSAVLLSVEIILTAVFLYSGFSKAFLPIPTLVRNGQVGIADIPAPVVRFAGTSELMGVLGLHAPRVLGRWPMLTPAAAIGFCMVLLLAAGVHLQRREYKTALANGVLVALAAFVVLASTSLVHPSCGPAAQHLIGARVRSVEARP